MALAELAGGGERFGTGQQQLDALGRRAQPPGGDGARRRTSVRRSRCARGGRLSGLSQ